MRCPRRIGVALLLAGTLVSVPALSRPAGASDRAANTALGPRVGIDAGSAILWEDDGVRQAELDAIAATGAAWFSLDVDWSAVQGQGPFEFDWTATDRVVREATARHLHVLGMLGYSPAWAQPANCPANTTHCLPLHVEDYARFAKAAALRYGTHAFDSTLRSTVTTWQIWNEPNHVPFVEPTVDVVHYTNLLRLAHDEIRKVDPTAFVLAGGTAPAPDDPAGRDMSPVKFLEGIYANGGGDAFDGFAHHPYSFPCSPLLNRPWNAFFQTYWLHEVMVRNGDGDRKVWGTEAGTPTGSDVGTCQGDNGASVTEADQARYAVDAARGWTQTFGSFTGPLFWFQIRDNGTDRSNYEDNFGLLRRDFSAKPAYAALTQFFATGIAAPDPTPNPVPGPAPNPPPVAPSACLTGPPARVLSGVQVDRLAESIDTDTTIDARSASWTQVDPWPVSTTGSGSICWNGGSIVGTWTMDTVWDVFHHTGAFNFANPNSVVENVRVHNYGDAINVRDGASNWTVRGAHTSFIHDDCLQDDYLNSGVIADSLFDGCYVGISTRPSSNNTTSDGRNNTLTMNANLLRLQPMPTVYKGPAPGHGGFFKWDDTGRSPSLSLHNNVFRVDQTPNHGSLGLPAGYRVDCSGNTIVWLGSGPFPEAASWLAQCPDTRIVTVRSVWDDAVSAWTLAH